MHRVILAAALALAVCACTSAPPRYDYAVFFTADAAPARATPSAAQPNKKGK